MGKRHRRPNTESPSLQSSRRGFDSWELLLLGPLHVELSSGHRRNHPPLQQPAPPPIPADRVEVSSVFAPPPPQKQTEHAGTTHTCSSARRHLYPDRSTGGPVRYSKGLMGGPTDPSPPAGLEPPSPGRAPSALPLGQRPPRYDLPLVRGATARRACTHAMNPCQLRPGCFSSLCLPAVCTSSQPVGLSFAFIRCKADVLQTSLLLPLLLGRPSRLLCVHAAYSLCTRGVWHAKLTRRQPALCFPLSFSGSARL